MSGNLKTRYLLSYLRETTFGENTINADTQTYLCGIIEKEQIMPAPVMEFSPFYSHDSRDFSDLSKGKASFNGQIIYMLQDGVWLYYLLGSESFTNMGDYNEHVLSGLDSGDLPSFTLHYEAADRSGNALVKDFFGCKINKMTLTGILGLPLACQVDIQAVKMQDGTKITSNYPKLPDTSNEKLFHFRRATFTWNSTEFAITMFTLSIDNVISPLWVHRSSNQELPKYLLEGNRVIGFSYSLFLEDSTILDEILTATARTLEIKFERDTHDFINIKLTNSYVKSAPLKIPAVNSANEYLVVGLSKECEITIEDKVAEYDSI